MMPSSASAKIGAVAGTYSAPTLAIYGDVQTLTASGTGSTAENGTQPSCTPQSTRKPC